MLRLQSSFRPLQPPAWPVAGRKPKPAPGSVVSSQKSATRSLNNPVHEQPSPFPRFVPVEAVGRLRNRAFSLAMLSWARKK